MNATTLDVATLGKRIGGGLIDLVLAWIVLLVIGSMAGYGATGAEDGQIGFSVNVQGWPAAIIGLGILLLYAVMEWKLGRTPGKMLVKTRVVTAAGGPIGFGQALVRNVLRIIDGLFVYLVAVIVIAVDKENRRVGDFAAGTRVING